MAKKKQGGPIAAIMGSDNKAHVSVSWPEGKSPDLSKCRIGKSLSVKVQGKVSSMSQDEYGSRVSLDVTPQQVDLGSIKGDLKQMQNSRTVKY